MALARSQGVEASPTFLVGIDFEAAADAALARAVALATAHRGHLVAVHVVDDRLGLLGRGLAGGHGGPAGGEDLAPAARGALEEKLSLAARALPQAESRLAFGSVAPALAEEARKAGAALIVAGVHRHAGGLLALAHTPGQLIRQAPCPVLLVHADDRGQTGPATGTGAPRALVALEPDDAAVETVAKALRLVAPTGARNGGFELVLLAARHAPALRVGGEAPGRTEPAEAHRSPELAALEHAAEIFRSRGHTVSELEEPARITPAELMERSEARNVDLVVTGLRGGLLDRLGLGAPGRAAPRLATPLLVVPLPPTPDA